MEAFYAASRLLAGGARNVTLRSVVPLAAGLSALLVVGGFHGGGFGGLHAGGFPHP